MSMPWHCLAVPTRASPRIISCLAPYITLCRTLINMRGSVVCKPALDWQTQKSAMRTEELMKVLGSIADAVVRLDGHGKYVSMNQAAEDGLIRLGHDPIAMIGRSAWKLFPEIMGTM